MNEKDFAERYYNEFPIMNDNQKPAVPSYYVCKKCYTHDPVWFVKCHSPTDLNRFQQDEAGAWMFQISLGFGDKGTPHPSDGYYVVFKRNPIGAGIGMEQDASMYFEELTATECESFSAMLKLPYHNTFDDE